MSGETIVSQMESVETRANVSSKPRDPYSVASVKADVERGGPGIGPIEYWKDGSGGSDMAQIFGHEILHKIYSGIGVPDKGYANPGSNHQKAFDDAANDIQ